METNQQDHVERELRQNWQNIRPQIQDLFPQVSRSDLDAARNVQDLVQRVGDKTGYSDRLVELRLIDIVGATQGGYATKSQQTTQGQQNQPQNFGSQQDVSQNRQYATSGAPFGGS